MNTYEREPIGNIIIMKNIVFQNTEKNIKEPDHAWKRGRPCIIIHSDNEYDYFLAIKSNITDEKFTDHYYPLTKKSYLHNEVNCYSRRNTNKYSERNTKGLVNLETIYKTPISGHDEIGKINFQTYKEIINKLKQYYQTKDLDEIIENAETIRGR